ncbi:MAG: adenosine deaminase, partial [Gemmatimonadales bacterium]
RGGAPDPARPAGGRLRRAPVMATLRVFVNDRPVEIARGATVWDAVRERDRGLAAMIESGAAYVTDGVGRTLDPGDAVREAGEVYRVVVTARRGPPRLTKEQLRRWPKAELHVHLDGALRPATMLELARDQGVRLPADTPEALAQAMLVRDARSLEEYLEKYTITLSVLQTAAALERVAYEFVHDVAAENVRYVEVRYSPLLHRPALTLAQAIEAPLAGITRAVAETGTKVGVIVCGIRTLPAEQSLELARAAADYCTAGVVAFDLAGAERGHPAREHRAAFEYAAAHGMACTCHAGEGNGPDSIHQALHECGAQRIGHGTRLGEDPELLARVIERRIPLEMCISSNVHTHTVAAATEHPFRRYLEDGVVVTLNTDGRLTDGVSLTDEYHLAHAALGLSKEQLARVALNAYESAFLPDYEKVALISRVQSELEALG